MAHYVGEVDGFPCEFCGRVYETIRDCADCEHVCAQEVAYTGLSEIEYYFGSQGHLNQVLGATRGMVV